MKVLDWIQSLSAIAVLIGIGLVVVELRQSREIAQAQVFTSNNDATMQMLESIAGENPTGALSKACTQPQDLTDQDMLVLDQLFTLWWLKAARHLSQSRESAGLAPAQAEAIATTFIVQINGTEHGRWWWDHYPHSPHMHQLGKNALGSTDYSCKKFIDAFKNLDELSWRERGVPEHD